MFAKVLIAVTGLFFELSAVEQRDMPAICLDKPGALKLCRSRGNRSATDAEHFGKELPRKWDQVRVGSIARLEKPAAQSRSDIVQRIARRCLLDLPKLHFIVTNDQILQMRTLRDNRTEARCGNLKCRSWDLHERANSGHARAQSRIQADRTFQPDHSYLYSLVLRHLNDKRNHAGLREKHSVDALTAFLKQLSLLNRNLAEMTLQQEKFIAL